MTDFDSKNLEVKITEEGTIVIEGNIHKEDNGKTKKQSFKRCFNFPGVTESSKVTSKLSTNNTLTITVQKQVGLTNFY